MIDHYVIRKEEGSAEKEEGFYEAIFTVSNGHVGTRGSKEEAAFTEEPADEGTFINGFYETEPIVYGETAYGYAKEHQTIQRVPNGKMQTIQYKDFLLGKDGRILEDRRQLNLKEGIYSRQFIWQIEEAVFQIEISRMASFEMPYLVMTKTKISNLSKEKHPFQFKTYLGPEKKSAEKDDNEDPRKAQVRGGLQYTALAADFPLLEVRTKNSKLAVVSGKKTAVSKKIAERKTTYSEKTKTFEESLTVSLESKEQVTFHSALYYSDSFSIRENNAENSQLVSDWLDEKVLSAENYFEEQKQHMKNFWASSGIELVGDDTLAQGMNFNLFHLYQAAGRDGKTNIAAKGLTGDGYEGHYFWDTEMYMLPFFIYTQPKIARNLLMYRHSILPQARERARELSIEKGAWFAWRTINGREASAYYPAGTAQVHINGDIAYAAQLYYETTGDEEFMKNYGLELLIETARFFEAFGFYEKDGSFAITGVSGPDEYSVLVNNNYYTNRVAKNNLQAAFKYSNRHLEDEDYRALFAKLGVTREEIETWQHAADKMVLLYDKELKLTLQDEAALKRKPWDLSKVPEENHPLLLHYHPMIIYQHQVNKQADTILAEYLFPKELTLEQQRRDYRYYENITTHDSSLSRSIFSIQASRIGFQDKAYPYFESTALMDLTDLQGNTRDGIHAANLGGTWLSMVYGFAGMTVKDGEIQFVSRLPEQWESLAFSICYRGERFRVKVTKEGVSLEKNKSSI